MSQRSVQSIIPPIVLENLEQNAPTAEARLAARRTSLLSERMRGLRDERAVEPNEGEQREVYDAQHGTSLPGRQVRVEDSPDVSDESVNEAYDGAGSAYAYYFRRHGRRSVDNAGMTMLSTVHFDRDFDNAFWDGSQMVYGDGHFFNPFTRDLTVIVHEITHAVTQFTAGLVYQDQPGALNEHISDAFAAIVYQEIKGWPPSDDRGWLIGAALVEGKINGRGLRDMLNGHAYDDPVIGTDDSRLHMRDLYTGNGDNGGVHINSGIPNRAFALAARMLDGMTHQTLGPVWYEALTTRTTARTGFAEFAAATYAVASGDAMVQHAVGDAWMQVGIDVSATPPPPTPDPTPSSPCETEIMDLLRDPLVRALVIQVAGRPAVRRLVARARLLSLKQGG